MAGEEDKDFDSFTLISTTSDGKAGLSDKLKAGKDWLQQKQASMKAWGEFLNLRRLSRPTSVGHATGRVLTNIRHFSTNYLFVFLGLAVYCVVTNPLLLIALAVCGAAYWFLSIKNRGETLRLLGRDCAPVEIYTVMGVIMVPVLYIAGAGSAVFWIIGASVVIILVHALFMTPPTQSSQRGDEEMGIVMEEISIS